MFAQYGRAMQEGCITFLSQAALDDGICHSWAANAIFSDEDSERNAASRALQMDLRDDYDKQRFLGQYRSKLEQSLHKAMLSK